MTRALIAALLFLSTSFAIAQKPELPAGVEMLRDYKAGEWTWKVAIVPKSDKQELIKIANQLSKVFPEQRVRIFDDKSKVRQFIDRDIWFNDKSGRAKEVDFPEQWTVKHHVANINRRSNSSDKRWQLVTRHGEHIAYLGSITR